MFQLQVFGVLARVASGDVAQRFVLFLHAEELLQPQQKAALVRKAKAAKLDVARHKIRSENVLT